ncbi:MAG: transcription-repair coupling factor, partial [Conexibacter sp.]
ELVAAGYERVDQVEDRGQFAIRGGILDLFPATEDRAVRVDLFGDEIESLRWFSTFTQRSLGDVDEVEVAPAAELAAEHRELAEAAAIADDAADRRDVAELLPVGDFHAMLDLVPDAAVLIAAEEEIAPALVDHWTDVCNAFHDDDAHHLYIAPGAIETALDARAKVRLSAIDQHQPFQFRGQAADVAARGLRDAEPELERLVRSGYRTIVAFGSRGEGERAAYNLGRLKVRWVDGSAPHAADLAFAEARLRDGFVAPGFRLAVIPEHRLFRRRAARTGGATQTGRRRGALRSFTDLRTGDIVVHEDHGLARFAGFDTKTVAGVTRDYLNLEFAGTDKVFLPVDQFAKISRYVGADGAHPPLSKLGGTRWETIKSRARKAAQELAGELLNLYAERRRREGHPFPPDGDWQREFEDAWPYRETADQREAIEQVKADMEASRPMDRLICGDVGYGKTEVALRAAFKAAADGRQVMVLVPTTILAQQHYGTFTERLKDYPFTIEHISRFRPAAEQRAAIKAFGEGKVDILIGTHRLLSRDVRARDLGLLIVDEEQRFGVKQKELLRQIKLKVDVLAMSATPIPRTLQMSIAGIRDLSVIETPPEGRRPVKTYVGEYDEQLVKAAIERELARRGQAFFLHNRVETIDETAERLRGLVPQARFVVAHGQLDERELERKMLAFLRGEADVLVATSIIESGIDIPQANTLIVERADHFGLAQLYQIRGRVGRSRERAYAYLLYPSAAALTPEAAQRLSALSDYTELGAGFKVAMRDLELRGAGNLLGDEQSGHVAALGFELYMQMLDEAVAELGGDGAEGGRDESWEPVRLDVNVDAYVPADYVPYEQAKIDVHRRIAGAREVAELHELRSELKDRFGELPPPLENLLLLQQARIKLGEAGARAVSFRGGRLAVTPIELDSRRAKAIREQIPEALYESGKSQLSMRVPDDPSARFPAVVRAADVLLAVTREAA